MNNAAAGTEIGRERRRRSEDWRAVAGVSRYDADINNGAGVENNDARMPARIDAGADGDLTATLRRIEATGDEFRARSGDHPGSAEKVYRSALPARGVDSYAVDGDAPGIS